MVTIDQLRGDMPWRMQDRLGPAGFRYLVDNGTAYTNAHFEHVITTTAAGHATLSTGGNTPQHGIAGNEWFDSETRQAAYNTEDERYPQIGETLETSKGRSPRNLTSSTFGDELVAASALGLDVAEVEQAVAAEIVQIPGFSLALTKTDILTGRVPDTLAARRVEAGFHPIRSGNVIVVQDQFWYLSSTPDGDTAMHGSPYNYDSHVPIMLAGPRIRHGKIDHRVAPRDVAPTISAYLGISPPSGVVGNPLPAIAETSSSP